ncbi:putative DNA polymerase III, epsilon subunit and related 3'-5'exonuclease [Parvularcula bermudensis HTCC2503]|uniref:DNA polymerase III subunit epsilon n=1 Tax=Parvularcula bermudensis (strain ATCC BAA-594 / HTCC2503 / KCTC 12087) TaxID=314260 RepID=E0TER5_PARBH|nr:DNA polymerase III subunit epsilon [Parvularcula bermudensis]ADM08948.1 putative DNA polymerase III, epsilon subunit and related 3'-5'exonuclease [Parvularcula bermudensis HTCC2503]
MRQIVFDTETTGLDPLDGHRVVEIGAVEMVNGALTGRTFHVYVNPERDMPEAAYRVHKLSSQFLADKPIFKDPAIGQAFYQFCEGAVLVAHNASFDCKFMQHHLDEIGLPWAWGEPGDIVDTLQIARKRFPGSPSSLDALCQRFGIDLTEREAQGHGALLDSRLLAEVYIELTGGRQGGLIFDPDQSVGGRRKARGEPARQRPGPRPQLLTDEEHAAHAALIGEMKDPLWARYTADAVTDRSRGG